MIYTNAIGFITVIIIYVPLLLLLTWYCVRGLKYFYKRYYKNELAYSSAFLEIRYFIAITFLFYGLTIFFVEYNKGYYSYKSITLDKPIWIDGILFPAKATGKFTKNEKGVRFHKVKFSEPFEYKGLKIYSISKTYDDFLRIVPISDVTINGIHCNGSSTIKIDYAGNLMTCFLNSGNVFSGIKIPERLKLEHYKATNIYAYYGKKHKDLDYQWTLNSVDSYTINGTLYNDVEFFIDKDLKIVKFRGDVAKKHFDEKELKSMIKKEIQSYDK
ncbi:MAG TPA: hypothetical protein EYG83_06820 [Sulfurospirillum arcachonense]|nr:hypothetical protein [Sulfurospirillum arcachonense]